MFPARLAHCPQLPAGLCTAAFGHGLSGGSVLLHQPVGGGGPTPGPDCLRGQLLCLCVDRPSLPALFQSEPGRVCHRTDRSAANGYARSPGRPACFAALAGGGQQSLALPVCHSRDHPVSALGRSSGRAAGWGQSIGSQPGHAAGLFCHQWAGADGGCGHPGLQAWECGGVGRRSGGDAAVRCLLPTGAAAGAPAPAFRSAAADARAGGAARGPAGGRPHDGVVAAVGDPGPLQPGSAADWHPDPELELPAGADEGQPGAVFKTPLATGLSRDRSPTRCYRRCQGRWVRCPM